MPCRPYTVVPYALEVRATIDHRITAGCAAFTRMIDRNQLWPGERKRIRLHHSTYIALIHASALVEFLSQHAHPPRRRVPQLQGDHERGRH